MLIISSFALSASFFIEPERRERASFLPLSPFADTSSSTASASVRSILPPRKALYVNSPFSASLNPASSRVVDIFFITGSDPWHMISTASSPVYPWPWLYTRATTSSTFSLFLSTIQPWTAVPLGLSVNLPLNTFCTRDMASVPLVLITASADGENGVARA